ncbi:MAG TPA: alpha/beta fold hydrolase [Xanthobacteraceae bacterium]|jgi:predicted alpha/beta hydrolase|nr:alpha/beta fold hydrolase [Xanthobacteraceae bacterium]
MTEILVQDTTIPARDGYPLAATVFTPDRAPKSTVLINAAAAVPRKIYRGFASYLAQHGFAALTYDYRGVAGSRPPSLRGFPARMRDWAALDAAAAIDHVRRVWPAADLKVVGHSFGGQAVGLMPNNSEISRALLVAAQAGYWRLFHAPEKYRVYLMMRFVGSPIAWTLGYVPGRLGIGEDLPRDVFLEWTRWVGQKRYFFDDPTLTALENFPRYRGKLRAISMTDDPWATEAAVNLLCTGFTGTAPERVDIRPRDVGAERIGHFGFFRPEHRDTLWRDAADWLARE